jgi:hypothetical protein
MDGHAYGFEEHTCNPSMLSNGGLAPVDWKNLSHLFRQHHDLVKHC